MSHREHATSCHFKWRMPLRVAYATSSGACHFKWRVAPWACHFMPLHSCRFKWRMPLQVACRTVSMPLHATSCHFKWRPHREHATSCHFMPLQVAVAPWACHFMPLHATSSGGRTVSMPLHATSCHFMPLHATSSGVKWREVAKSVYAPPACSMEKVFESITHQIKNYQNLYETLRARRCDTTSGRLIRLKPSGSIRWKTLEKTWKKHWKTNKNKQRKHQPEPWYPWCLLIILGYLGGIFHRLPFCLEDAMSTAPALGSKSWWNPDQHWPGAVRLAETTAITSRLKTIN